MLEDDEDIVSIHVGSNVDSAIVSHLLSMAEAMDVTVDLYIRKAKR